MHWRKHTGFLGRIEYIKDSFENPADLIIHHIKKSTYSVAVIYFKSLADKEIVQREIIDRLQHAELHEPLTETFRRIISTPSTLEKTDDKTLLDELLDGSAIVLIEGESDYICCSVFAVRGREPSPSESEITIRGPHEAFTERLEMNISLLRMRIRHPKLRLKSVTVGKEVRTRVVIAYLEHIAPQSVLDELVKRLNKIDVNYVLESQQIEENIQDKTLSVFPTIANSERTDVIAAKIVEGRVAIFTDGTPFVLTVPTLFVEYFQTPEDYYQRWDISTLLRILRFSSFLWGIFVPALFVALTTFHQEMIPTELLISIAAQREGVPYPAFFEVMVMELIFEVLREAGLRMPKPIGSAISIVGALVLGQSAVQAGLISAAVVIVVSITAIANFVSPAYNFGISARVLRFFFLILAGSLGFYGMFFGIMMVLIHAASLQSFGVSFLSPFAPLNLRDLRDSYIKLPDNWVKNKLPKAIARRRERH
ncbi:spore germination protein [Bacillus tianshenii]|nr:spore germination protein [Bacillus tianshenii]